MPLVTIRTSSVDVSDDIGFMKELSKELSSLTGKPESYVMTTFDKDVSMTFAGTTDPACYVEVKSIGSLNPSQISQSLSTIIESWTGVSKSRIYIQFEDVSPSNWGFNGSTFG